MVIHYYILHVVVVEKVVPQVSIGLEAIMEDKENIRVDLSHGLADLSVVVLKYIVVRAPPWFVNGLQCVHGWMLTIHVHESNAVIDSPLYVVVVDVVIRGTVPVAHPVCGIDRPVLEVSLVNPFNV